MAQPEALGAPPTGRRWAALGKIKDRLVRLVARAPATVRTKLLVAFLGIAALLVLVTVLGLRCSVRRTRASPGSTPCSSVPPGTKRSKRTLATCSRRSACGTRARRR